MSTRRLIVPELKVIHCQLSMLSQTLISGEGYRTSGPLVLNNDTFWLRNQADYTEDHQMVPIMIEVTSRWGPSEIIWNFRRITVALDVGRAIWIFVYSECNIYRSLNLHCEIFGTSSYGEGRTSLRVRLLHMNEWRIFHNINSKTLYTLKIFILRLIMLKTCTSKSAQCSKWPQCTSNPTLPATKQRIHTHAKPSLLARNGKRR